MFNTYIQVWAINPVAQSGMGPKNFVNFWRIVQIFQETPVTAPVFIKFGSVSTAV